MANTSIVAAFERMWQHVVTLVNGKASANHSHDDIYYTESEIDSKLQGFASESTIGALQEDINGKADTDHSHDEYISIDEKGAANGVATLNESGIIPSSQLPSYVDDVLEFATRASFPATGESGKIYVDTTANVTYRWSGSTYTEISKSLALGTTASTAAAGNHGHKLSELENDSGFATTEYVDTKAACLTVNVTKSGTTFSADATFSVISAAIDSNTTVYAKYNNTIYYPALKTAALIMFRSHGSSSEDIINIMSSGVVTAAYSSLPVATEDSLGGIKSGGDISVSTDGIVTVNPSVVQEAYNLADTANTIATNALTAASGAQTTADAAMPKAGGTMTGALVAQSNTNYTTKQVRNIILVADGEEIPAGVNGDICLVYAP